MDQRLVVVSRLFYEQQLSKTEIAGRLGISITHVGRLLKEALRTGIVKILIEPPDFEGLEVELKERFDLRDARVVLGADEDSLRREIGIAAAGYFEREVKSGETVGLGSGRTLFEMVSEIQEKERAISIYPLSVCAEQDLEVKSIDSNTLVKILWFKSGAEVASAKCLELFFPDEEASVLRNSVQSLVQKRSVKRLEREISDLDNYFFSCSSIREGSQLTGLQRALGEAARSRRGQQPIGDIVFNAIGAGGEYIPTQIEDVLFRVSLDTLHGVSSDRRKRVVLAAGGNSKIKVIDAGLQAGLFNVLITDNVTAELLLRTRIAKGG